MSDYAERVAYRQVYEERIKAVQDSIEIDAAMRDGAAFRMLVDALNKEEFRALNDLALCNPPDVTEIIHLQERIWIARMVRDFIQNVQDRGQYAEQSLKDEDTGRI